MSSEQFRKQYLKDREKAFWDNPKPRDLIYYRGYMDGRGSVMDSFEKEFKKLHPKKEIPKRSPMEYAKFMSDL